GHHRARHGHRRQEGEGGVGLGRGDSSGARQQGHPRGACQAAVSVAATGGMTGPNLVRRRGPCSTFPMAFTARAALLTALIGLFPVVALAQPTASADTAASPPGASSDTA